MSQTCIFYLDYFTNYMPYAVQIHIVHITAKNIINQNIFS